MISVTVLGVQKEYEEGTSLLTISKEVQEQYKYPIILAKVNQGLRELSKCVEHGDTIEFLIISARSRMRRSVFSQPRQGSVIDLP